MATWLTPKGASGRSGIWRDREVRGLLGAQVASEVGDQFARVAVTLLVLREAQSTFLAALVLALSYVPSVGGGLLLGALADRFPRRELMAACDALRAVLVLGLAAVVVGAPLWVPFAVLLLVELVSVPFSAARSAVFPDVAPQPNRLQAALGASRTLQQANMVVGLALGGLVVAATSAPVALVIDAASYVLSAAILLRCLRRRGRPNGGTARYQAAVREGVQALIQDRARRCLVGLGWLLGASVIAPEAVALAYAMQHHAPELSGVLLAAVPAGGAVGALCAVTLHPSTMVRLLLPLAALSCVPLIATLPDPGVLAVLVLWFVAGVFQGLLLPSLMVLVALVTPARLRGRVAASAGAGFALLSALGLAAVGALADRTSAAVAVGVAGVLALAVIGAVALAWPREVLAGAVARAGSAGPVPG